MCVWCVRGRIDYDVKQMVEYDGCMHACIHVRIYMKRQPLSQPLQGGKSKEAAVSVGYTDTEIIKIYTDADTDTDTIQIQPLGLFWDYHLDNPTERCAIFGCVYKVHFDLYCRSLHVQHPLAWY